VLDGDGIERGGKKKEKSERGGTGKLNLYRENLLRKMKTGNLLIAITKRTRRAWAMRQEGGGGGDLTIFSLY